MFSLLLQGALLNGELIKRASLDASDVGTSEKAREAFLFAQRRLHFSLLVEWLYSQALTADLTGRAFEKMGDFFLPLLKTKDVLRWCSSEAVL